MWRLPTICRWCSSKSTMVFPHNVYSAPVLPPKNRDFTSPTRQPAKAAPWLCCEADFGPSLSSSDKPHFCVVHVYIYIYAHIHHVHMYICRYRMITYLVKQEKTRNSKTPSKSSGISRYHKLALIAIMFLVVKHPRVCPYQLLEPRFFGNKIEGLV